MKATRGLILRPAYTWWFIFYVSFSLGKLVVWVGSLDFGRSPYERDRYLKL